MFLTGVSWSVTAYNYIINYLSRRCNFNFGQTVPVPKFEPYPKFVKLLTKKFVYVLMTNFMLRPHTHKKNHGYVPTCPSKIDLKKTNATRKISSRSDIFQKGV